MQDGRDVPDGSSKKFVAELEKELAALDGVDAKIASGGGRMYVTMDRYEVRQSSIRWGNLHATYGHIEGSLAASAVRPHVASIDCSRRYWSGLDFCTCA